MYGNRCVSTPFPSGYYIRLGKKLPENFCPELILPLRFTACLEWNWSWGQEKNHLDSGPTHVLCNPFTRENETSVRPSPPYFIFAMKNPWSCHSLISSNNWWKDSFFFPPPFSNYLMVIIWDWIQISLDDIDRENAFLFKIVTHLSN